MNKHSFLITIMSFFFFSNNFHQVCFISPVQFPALPHEARKGPRKCTTFPERTERQSSNGRRTAARLVVKSPHGCNSRQLDLPLSGFSVWHGRGGLTGRLPGSDPYPCNNLEARSPFRAKGSPDLCLFTVLGTPLFLSAALLRHIHNVTSIRGCDGRIADWNGSEEKGPLNRVFQKTNVRGIGLWKRQQGRQNLSNW